MFSEVCGGLMGLLFVCLLLLIVLFGVVVFLYLVVWFDCCDSLDDLYWCHFVMILLV